MAPIPTKISANVPMNSAKQARSLSIPRCNQIACAVTSAREDLPRSAIVGFPSLPAGVIRIFLAQLPHSAVCFVGLSGALIGGGRFLQRARRDSRIIVKQCHAHERFARVFETA